MPENAKYVTMDEHGVMRVADTHVMLDSVVIAFQQGDSAEAIQRQYPSLSLEQVYDAIAHYLAHQDEVDEYLTKQEQVWTHWRQKFGQTCNPTVERLRAMKRASAEHIQ